MELKNTIVLGIITQEQSLIEKGFGEIKLEH